MKYKILLFLLFAFSAVRAQISGKITDGSTDEPIGNALLVFGKGRSLSGSDGAFSVAATDFISVYAEGFQTVYIKTDTLRSPKASIVIPLHRLNYNLSEVNLTAYNSPEKLMTVSGAVSVLPVDSLQYSGYNIASSISLSPGLVIQEATPGTMKLTLRGIGSRYPYGTKKIKMFFDGIPLFSAEGETYFDDINPEYLGRIEILRGPASSIYGASLGGAIVLYPRRAECGSSEVSLMSTFGSYGYLKNTLNYSGGSGKGDLFISLSDFRSDGYRKNSNYQRKSILLNYNHRIGEKLSGGLLISGSFVHAEIPSSVDSASFSSNPQSAAPLWLKTKGNKSPVRILAGYKLKYQPSNNLEIISSLFSTFRENEENRPFNFLDESGISYGGRLIARYAKETNKLRYKITAGSNLFFESYNNTISQNPDGIGIKGGMLQKGKESINQLDLFSQLDVYVSDFILTAGFNLNKSGFTFTDQFSIDSVDQSGSLSFDPVLSPRVSVSWHPLKGFSSYVAVNHGFTIPALSETMTPLGLINNSIKPEKAWSYETGGRFDLFRNRTFIDLALYYMKVDDLIVPKRVDADFYIGTNAGSSLHKGVEISIQQALWGKAGSYERNSNAATVNLSYSLNSFRFLEFIDSGNDYSGNLLPGIPESYFAGNLDMKFGHGIHSQIEVLSSGKMPLNDFNSRYTDPYTVINIRAGYSVSIMKVWAFEIMSGINNISDTHYASMVVVNAPGTETKPPRYYYPGMPRWFTFTIGLKYRFLNFKF
jgi:iron complex outermembrane receptor protein